MRLRARADARPPRSGSRKRTRVSDKTVSGKSGGDLLFHALRQSTIGAAAFHGRVRDGIGWDDCAMTTRLAGNG